MCVSDQLKSRDFDVVMHELPQTGECSNGYPVFAQTDGRADSFKFVSGLCRDGGQCGDPADNTVVSIESCSRPGTFLRHCNYHIWAGSYGTGPNYDFMWQINAGSDGQSVQLRTTADQFGARDMEVIPGNDNRVTMVTDGNHEDWYLIPAHSDADAALGLVGCFQDCSTNAAGQTASRTCDEVVADVQTIEQCQAQCTAGSYAYMGMACPRAGAFECWCCNSFDDNSAGHNAAIPDEECSGGALTSGVNGNRQDHCSGFANAGDGGYILDGYNLGGHCRVAVYDMNVINTQGSNACDGINPASYTQECSDITEWHATIDMSSYSPTDVCTMLVSTSGSTCGDYCASQGRVCMHAQDNDGGCALAAAHDRQTTVNNGCDQTWGDQICGCGAIGHGRPPPGGQCVVDAWQRLSTGIGSDFQIVSGSASKTGRDIRSGNPHAVTEVRLPNVVSAQPIVRLRFNYQYVVGYGRYGAAVPANVQGPTFTVSIVDSATDARTVVYTSPVLDTYDYDTCAENGGWGDDGVDNDGCYAPATAVNVQLFGVTAEFYVLFTFTNNDRNMHLNEDGMNMAFGTCGGGACNWQPVPSGLGADFTVTGPASKTGRDIRSGNPHEVNVARLPDVTTAVPPQRLSFTYEYVVGYGRYGRSVPDNVMGPTFTVGLVDAVTGVETIVYTSPVLDTFDYDTCGENGGWGDDSITGDGCYSSPVSTQAIPTATLTCFHGPLIDCLRISRSTSTCR